MFQTKAGLLPHNQKNNHLPMSFVRFTNLPASANSAQTAKFWFLVCQRPQKHSLGWEPRVTFSQITGEGRWKIKIKIKIKRIKRPTHPFFFWLCYPNYTYLFYLALSNGSWLNAIACGFRALCFSCTCIYNLKFLVYKLLSFHDVT
jgi:hypothetical protein